MTYCISRVNNSNLRRRSAVTGAFLATAVPSWPRPDGVNERLLEIVSQPENVLIPFFNERDSLIFFAMKPHHLD